jgi:elongation factor Ts
MNMAEITAALVKELREKTGVGMMDCKKALAETNGDLEAAIDWLRAKGLSKAAKKADRAAAEGLVGVAVEGNRGAVIEFNSETDFVARNEGFQRAAGQFAKAALANKGDRDKILAAPGEGGTIQEQITQLIATIGENMSLRRVDYVEVSEGVVAPYVHGAVADGLGRIGVLVALESRGKRDVLSDVAKKVAMHVAATGPLALSDSEVPAEAVARERAVYEEQVKEDPKMVGKPENVLKGVVEGRLRKFFEEVVLTKQKFVMAPDQTVEAWVKGAEKDAGAPINIAAFRYFRLGEGVEKPKDDFAAEVAGMTGKS